RTCLVSIGPRRPNRFGRLIPGTTGQLRPKPVIDAGRAVDKVVQLVLVGDALLPGDLRAVSSRRSKSLSRRPKRGCGAGIKRQLTAHRSCGERLYHGVSIPQIERPCKYEATSGLKQSAPPTAKAGGFPRLKASIYDLSKRAAS